MSKLSLKNPWLFTVLVIFVWLILWATLEFVFFNVDLLAAVMLGGLTGLVLGLLYVVFS